MANIWQKWVYILYQGKGQYKSVKKMIMSFLKFSNLDRTSIQIRFYHGTTSAGTQQWGMSFELIDIQLGTLKLTCNLNVHNTQISIVHHDHIPIFTWFSTYIIVHWLERSNFSKRVFKLKIKISVLMKTLQSNLSWLHRASSSLCTLEERPS
jgi:hypothetical protein